MNINWGKVVKIAVPLAGAAVSLASNWLGQKELDEKVTEKVAEALQKTSEKN